MVGTEQFTHNCKQALPNYPRKSHSLRVLQYYFVKIQKRIQLNHNTAKFAGLLSMKVAPGEIKPHRGDKKMHEYTSICPISENSTRNYHNNEALTVEDQYEALTVKEERNNNNGSVWISTTLYICFMSQAFSYAEQHPTFLVAVTSLLLTFIVCPWLGAAAGSSPISSAFLLTTL